MDFGEGHLLSLKFNSLYFHLQGLFYLICTVILNENLVKWFKRKTQKPGSLTTYFSDRALV